MTPSAYEQRARVAIDQWKNPKKSWLTRVGKIASTPLDYVSKGVMNAPYVGVAIEKAVSGIVGLANDAAQWSVRPEVILAEYRAHGHPDVHHSGAIGALDLEQVDRRIGWLGAKYKAIAAAEGGGTGLLGLPGIPLDIIALVTLNLRAIGEYGAYCGFDMASQHERLYAMNVLGLASSPTDASKAATMAQLGKIASDVARRKTWKDLEKHAFTKLIKKIAESLGVRLTKAKLAQIVPVAGAAVGAGFNAYFTSKVCDSSYFLFRERFLTQKYEVL